MPTATPEADERLDHSARAWLAVLLGIAVTLCVRGYRYGESNHAVYLIDALRRVDPTLLTHDWWTNQTLQYHFVFNAVSGWLMKLGVIEPAFLVGYVALAMLLHVAWFGLARDLGGDVGAYALSVVLFYFLGAGLGLGSYHFLQDSSFLPSNVSNVAMLWGIWMWARGRVAWAGVALGVAGLFHINHAAMGVGMWFALSMLELRKPTPSPGTPGEGGGEGAFVEAREEGTLTPTLSRSTGRRGKRRWLLGTLGVLALCLPAIAPAAHTVLTRSNRIPLTEFVDLFVHLRHPHHFDAMSWHWALWLIFLLPVPFAVAYARRVFADARPHPCPLPEYGERACAVRRAAQVFLVITAATLAALVGAGVWFFSESLVQLNLYRFSIYLKLLSCIGAGCWLARAGLMRGRGATALVLLLALLMVSVIAAGRRIEGGAGELVRRNAPAVLLGLAWAASVVAVASAKRVTRVAAVIVPAFVVAVVVLTWPRLGLTIDAVRGDPPEYVELATWARDHTPNDAVFLVPPEEQSFRLHARRAIVVNYKNVPQLSAELPEWRDRLQEVLDLPDLMTLPKGMGKTLVAIRDLYAALPPSHLAQTAKKYAATYVVTSGNPEATAELGWQLVHQAGPFRLYSVNAP